MAADNSTIVLLTGANAGIGYATTQVLTAASPNYHVIMAGRSSEKIEKAAAEIQSAPDFKGTVSTLTLDVTDEDSIAAAAATVAQKFGRVDVLLNNAGISSTNPNLKQEYTETLVANAIGPVLVTEAFKDLVRKSQNGKILHVTSGLGSLGRFAEDEDMSTIQMWTAYRMSKAALNMYMIKNEKEMRDSGVKVFGVCPGLVRSNLRGTDEKQISAGGRAGDPKVSGQLMLDIIEGRRDDGIGKTVKKDGLWTW